MGLCMHSPENMHTHPIKDMIWSLEILMRRGGLNRHHFFFSKKYEAKLEILGGWEDSNQRIILGHGVDIFFELHIVKSMWWLLFLTFTLIELFKIVKFFFF